MPRNTGRTHFNSNTAKAAGKKSKRGKSIKSLLKDLLEKKCTDEELKAVAKRVGYKGEITHHESLVAAALLRAVRHDRDFRTVLELTGELEPANTSQEIKIIVSDAK